MRPILLSLGSLRLYGYGAAIAVGGLLTFRVLWLRRREAGFPNDESYWAFMNLCPMAGFLGGKILSLIQDGSEALSLAGGYSVFGGFVGVAAAVAAFARWKKIPLAPLADHAFFGAALWHGFGRIGCFLAGCCYGRPTELPWGVRFTDPRSLVPESLLGASLHPAQLYEAAGDFLIAALLWLVLLATDEGRLKPGSVVIGHFAAYGALRFAVEFVRGDAMPLLGPLSAGQGLGLGLIAAAGAILVWRRRCILSC